MPELQEKRNRTANNASLQNYVCQLRKEEKEQILTQNMFSYLCKGVLHIVMD